MWELWFFRFNPQIIASFLPGNQIARACSNTKNGCVIIHKLVRQAYYKSDYIRNMTFPMNFLRYLLSFVLLREKWHFRLEIGISFRDRSRITKMLKNFEINLDLIVSIRITSLLVKSSKTSRNFNQHLNKNKFLLIF